MTLRQQLLEHAALNRRQRAKRKPRTPWSGGSLAWFNLSGANLKGADLCCADLSDADLSGANLEGAELTGANLEGAGLTGAKLYGALLSGANLRGASLEDANLRSASLGGANLTGANLEGANLRVSNLSGANLTGASLEGANLEYANISGARMPFHVPVVPDLDEKIAEAIGKDGRHLDMRDWHTCETTHCRAGWAIHLAGVAGYRLEKRIGPAAAGAFIYWRSAGYVPDFYADDESALNDIRERARK